MPEHSDCVGMRKGSLDDEPDAGFGEQGQERHKGRNRHHQHKHFEGREGRLKQCERREVQEFGDPIIDRHLPPDHLDPFLDDEGEAKREEEFRHMAEFVHCA